MSDHGTVSTRLDPAEYLRHLDADSARILDCWRRGPDLPVPTCPGWDATDLLRHVGAVYAHKVVALRTGAQPAADSWSTGPGPDEDDAAWFESVSVDLAGELARRAPDEPCWTWWPGEQTVGFWQRRMAQESLVHRYDAESAVGDVTPLDDALARDGVDELLGWLTWPWDDDPQADADGRSIAVVCEPPAGDADGHGHGHATVWTLTFHPTRVVVAPPREVDDGHVGGVAAEHAAVVLGAAPDLLLRLWGRRPDLGRSVGDETVLGWLAARLAAAES